MEVVTISPKFQVVIPRSVRERLDPRDERTVGRLVTRARPNVVDSSAWLACFADVRYFPKRRGR